ncbi:GVQW3 protein, partial [Acromyrmex heyeri]
RIHDLMKKDYRITTRMIAEKLGISNDSVQTILKEDLNMRKLCTKIVPKVLTDEQKQRCTVAMTEAPWSRSTINMFQKINLLMQNFYVEVLKTILDHPPYSSDLAPCDFYLFPKEKISCGMNIL